MRHWTLKDKKLVETYEVKKNGNVLTGEAENYFENYLTSLIPPNLFDFFFFDGEDLSDAFIGRSASSHLKESILKLSNYDTLDILKKHLLQYQRSTSISSEKLKDLEMEYNLANEELSNNKNIIKCLEANLQKANIRLENIRFQKSKLIEQAVIYSLPEANSIKDPTLNSFNISLNEYIDASLEFDEKIVHINAQIKKLASEIETLKEKTNLSEHKLKKVKNAYLHSMQGIETLKLTNNLVEALDEIIFELTKEKIHEIEDNFIYIFRELIRRDNYIYNIEIQTNFETTLYISKEYNSIEVLNLLKNLGTGDVEKKYGRKFLDDLKQFYPYENKKDLLHNIESDFKSEPLILKTKFDINNFSKSEKQIYIFCLVWALIKSCGAQIPFVMHTPYARIDRTHRDLLTTKYLPKVSTQVIILSTNEEIDNELYSILKNYICNEYLLQFLDKERKTKVHDGYFFEV